MKTIEKIRHLQINMLSVAASKWFHLYDDQGELVYSFVEGNPELTIAEISDEAEFEIYNRLDENGELDKLNDGLQLRWFHMRQVEGENQFVECDATDQGARSVLGMSFN